MNSSSVVELSDSNEPLDACSVGFVIHTVTVRGHGNTSMVTVFHSKFLRIKQSLGLSASDDGKFEHKSIEEEEERVQNGDTPNVSLNDVESTKWVEQQSFTVVKILLV